MAWSLNFLGLLQWAAHRSNPNVANVLCAPWAKCLIEVFMGIIHVETLSHARSVVDAFRPEKFANAATERMFTITKPNPAPAADGG